MNNHSPETPESQPPVEMRKPRSMWRSVWIGLLVFVLIVVVAGLTAPMTIRCRKKSEQTEAVNNARQIGLALLEFETEYGKLPEAGTIEQVVKNSGNPLPLQIRTSNDFFRQLIVAGIAQSETMFYAQIAGTKKPDGRMAGADALAKSECGFSYISGLSFKGNPSRPLIVTPLIPGTDRFDPTKFDGKAVILKMDNSVTSFTISKDGHVMQDGINLLDPKNPIWGPDDKFTIVWPDL